MRKILSFLFVVLILFPFLHFPYPSVSAAPTFPVCASKQYLWIPVTACVIGVSISDVSVSAGDVQLTVRQDSGVSIRILSAHGQAVSQDGSVLGSGEPGTLPITFLSGQEVPITIRLSSSYTVLQLQQMSDSIQTVRVTATVNYCLPWTIGSGFWAWSGCLPGQYQYDQTFTKQQLIALYQAYAS